MQKLLELASTWLEMHSIFKMLHCWPKEAGRWQPSEMFFFQTTGTQNWSIGGCWFIITALFTIIMEFETGFQLQRWDFKWGARRNHVQRGLEILSSAIYVMQAGTSWNVCANIAIHIYLFVASLESFWFLASEIHYHVCISVCHLEQHDADNMTQMVIDVKTPWKWKSLEKEISQETNERTKEKQERTTNATTHGNCLYFPDPTIGITCKVIIDVCAATSLFFL